MDIDRYSVILRISNVKQAHTINLVVNLFDDMIKFDVAFSIFVQNSNIGFHPNFMRNNLMDSSWTLQPNGWMKISVGAPRSHSTRSHSVGCVLRDYHT